MAEEDVDDSELKDEELVDFEGSDYDIGTEEEFEIEAEVFGIQDTEEARELKSAGEARLHERHLTESIADLFDSAGEICTQCQVAGEDNTESPDLQSISDVVPSSIREAAESGEIEEEKDDKDEGAVLQPSSNTRLDALKPEPALGIGEGRQRKHRKPDLEDGELDDAAMLEGFNIVTEGRSKGEILGREKKRRKDRFVVERQAEDLEGNYAKESEVCGFTTKQQQNRSSDRIMERWAGFARGGGRGVNMRMMSFGPVNMVPNVMGPGRPYVPFGMQSLGRAFGPLGGIASQGRHNVQFQELLAQEHLLRARAMQLAQGSIAGAMRAPLTGPLGGAALRPFLGFEFLGPGSQSLLQFQPQPSDAIAQMNVMGPVDGFIRRQRPNMATGAVVGSGKSRAQLDAAPAGSGLGRQGGWPLVAGADEIQSLGRGRSGPGAPSGSWSEAQSLCHGLGGQGLPTGLTNANKPLNVSATPQGLAAGIQNMSSGKVTKVGWLGLSASQADGTSGLNKFDARWKIERERMLRNGLLHAGLVADGITEEIPSGIRKECGKDDNSKKGKGKVSVLQDKLPPSSIATHSSSESKDKSTALANVSSSRSSAGSNVIQLLQPIRKSRMLTVSGLPDNISMSTIVEAFEKQGKITDLRKGTQGGVFTISFSTEIEAVTAKRSLHRSFLAGRQITVEYAYR